MLTELALWYLRKRKKSVIIGFEVQGGKATSLYNSTYYYDNSFVNTEFHDMDGKPFNIPSGKFSMTRVIK